MDVMDGSVATGRLGESYGYFNIRFRPGGVQDLLGEQTVQCRREVAREPENE